MPKRALQLYDDISRIESEREPGAELPPNLVGNWGRALAVVGRFKEARAAFDEVCRRWQEKDEAVGNLQCAIDQGTLALQTGAFTEVAGYLRRADQFLDADLSPASPIMLRRKEIEGRLELASGHFTQALALFNGMLATKVISPWTLSAELGKAEIELAAGNHAAAVQQAQQALKTASAMQGDLPYSNQTGLASLMLGRAWQQQGDRDQAKKALEAAVAHLSNTVDADHPDLVSAQRLLRSF
jgi:tetratricopeptide (TPR) repeat protein